MTFKMAPWGITMSLPFDQSINQPKNVFQGKIMILRNITWTHSLVGIGVIKRCCSIHVIGNSLILTLGKQV